MSAPASPSPENPDVTDPGQAPDVPASPDTDQDAPETPAVTDPDGVDGDDAA